MKKVLFGLGVVAVLSFPIVGMAYGESEDKISPNFKYVFPVQNYDYHLVNKLKDLTYGNDFDEIDEIIDISKPNLLRFGEPGNQEYNNFEYYSQFYYPFSVADMNKATGFYGIEGNPNSLDFLRYFHSLEGATLESYGTDFRAIENSKNLTDLEIMGPINSFEFISKMRKTQSLFIHATKELESYNDNTIKALSDISFINSLPDVDYVRVFSDSRKFPTVTLKKSMNQYVIVNPFILSKQFKNPEVKITSKTSNFTFEDDILTWDRLTPETNELQISWEFKTNENGHFEFSGDSVIPINWID